MSRGMIGVGEGMGKKEDEAAEEDCCCVNHRGRYCSLLFLLLSTLSGGHVKFVS